MAFLKEITNIPDLPGVVTDTEPWEGLTAMVEDAKHTWFASRLKDG